MKLNKALCLFLLFSMLAALPQLARVSAQQQTPAQQAGPATLQLAGLRERVTVRRDERGIPYIEASNEDDLYFAQGYVTASDRLWEMDILRRTARGELAEIFGRVALDEDKRHRIYGFARLSEEAASRVSTEVRAPLEAYTRGVNAFIASRDAKSLPVEFQILRYAPRAWTPADSLVVGKIFAETLSTTWDTDIMRAALSDLPEDKRAFLLPETSPLDVLVVGSDKRGGTKRRAAVAASLPGFPSGEAERAALLRTLSEVQEIAARSLERVGLYIEDRAASNNWVVAGSRTASGKPLLANDPHLPPTAPSIWYMTHLSAPGLRVAGVTAPGAPGIILGHNERIAWGATNLGPDVQDVYLEKFDKENPRRYMTPQGWREAELRREEIKVRRSAVDTSTDSVPFDVTVTRHGPIIFEKDAARYALRWTSLDPETIEFEAFYRLNRARNWNEFRAALKSYEGPTQNFIYADTDGHIGYYGAGKIPIRRSGDGSLPYDGAKDDGEWTSYIPFEGLPHVYDPPSGMIVTANSRVAGLDYPYHLTHEWFAPVRSRRIYELLNARQKLTADDFRAIQSDVTSISAQIFAREVVKAARESVATTNDEAWQRTLQMLEGWDGRINADSRVALLASEMRTAFRQKILVAAIGPERAKDYSWSNAATFIDRTITERPRQWLPPEFKNYAELLRACDKEARESLTKRYGADESKWTWGAEAKSRFPHPLAAVPIIGQQFLIAPFPQNGSGSSFPTVNVGASVSMRLIADPSNWDRTQQGIALGESGNPSSPHWKDQLADWQAVTPRVFPFTQAAVVASAKETIVLAPK
jgi:penicillin amidase